LIYRKKYNYFSDLKTAISDVTS